MAINYECGKNSVSISSSYCKPVAIGKTFTLYLIKIYLISQHLNALLRKVYIDNNCPLCLRYYDYKNYDEKDLFARSPLGASSINMEITSEGSVFPFM